MTTELQVRLLGFGYRPCPFDDPEHFQEVDDPCLVCGGLGTGGEPDKCVGNIDLFHNEAAAEIARLTSEVERLTQNENICPDCMGWVRENMMSRLAKAKAQRDVSGGRDAE